LEHIYQPGYLYPKAGVIVTDLVPAEKHQLGLFDKENRSKIKKLMQKLDEVNHIFGRDTVRMAVQDYGTNWKLKQETLSPSYTTNINQVPKAKA
jgi:DNA polymerase V